MFLLPPLEMDGYLTGTLVTPNLPTSQWITGLWSALPVEADPTLIAQSVNTAISLRKTIEANLAKGWPGFTPGFCREDQIADHHEVHT